MPLKTQRALRPPRAINLLREGRVAFDLLNMMGPLLRPAPVKSPLERRHIMVLPGFGADDVSTWPLRRYLTKLGQTTEGWGLGRNLAGADIPATEADFPKSWNAAPIGSYHGEAGVPLLCEKAREHVLARHRALKAPITLIGWSLGGYVAREVARDLPKIVSQVITLGSPVVGGPKYTSVAGLFRLRKMDLDWIERESKKRESKPITVPITAIVSPTDGVVGFEAALDRLSPDVTHVELDGAHIGLGVNPRAWAIIVQALAQQDQRVK